LVCIGLLKANQSLPRDSVSCYWVASSNPKIEMKDESYIVALPVGLLKATQRFDKIFFQSGIGVSDFDCLLANRWGNYAPGMANEDYEIIELPEAYSEYVKRWNIEDRSNKTIKTMTGYDYIEAVIGLPSVVQ
jgi:hypothetical protein